jgi:hypothetical protein
MGSPMCHHLPMATRPELTDVAAAEQTQFGVIFEELFSDDVRDFAGPFPTPEAAQAALATLRVAEDDEGQPKAKILEWDARRARLAQGMDEHRIHPNQDYDFSQLVDILAGDADCGRYAVLRSDESYSIYDVHATLEEAQAAAASGISDDTLNRPDGILDLDTGAFARPQFTVSFSFDD